MRAVICVLGGFLNKQEIADAVASGVKSALSELSIDNQTHFKHHQIMGSWLKWTSNIKKSFWTGLVLGFLGFVWLLIDLGFEAYLKLKGGLIG